MNFSWWTFGLQAINFLILVWLLQRFLFKPVKAIVARRKEEITRDLTAAAAEKERAERLRREMEAREAAIGTERRKIIDAAHAQASADRQKLLADARGEAEEIRARTLRQLEQDRAAAADELFERTVAIATNLAERLLREIAIASIEQPFLMRVLDYLDRLPADERGKLFPRAGASALLVTTAHPLGDQDQSHWREQLAQRLGPDCGVRFNADPALVAGAVLTFPQAILRFNWRDGLAAALKELRGDERPR